jgi:mannose-6-phosphate isomerase-like protein (cupin superfamily)
MKAGKVWGSTELILSTPTFEIHRIETHAGGYCSKHKHVHRYNAFYVESGTMEIHVWKNDYDLVDITTLHEGEITTVPPGEYHMFKSISDCVVFEIYHLTNFDINDIVRESVGGNSE